MLTLDIPDTVCYDVLSNFATKQNMLHIIYFLINSHIYIDLSNNWYSVNEKTGIYCTIVCKLKYGRLIVYL